MPVGTFRQFREKLNYVFSVETDTRARRNFPPVCDFSLVLVMKNQGQQEVVNN